jgi:hypothetical protein
MGDRRWNCENSQAKIDDYSLEQGETGDADQRLIPLRTKLNKCQV